MYKSFRSNPNYLTRYHALSGLFWLQASLLALAFTDLNHLLWFLPSLLLLSSVDVRRVGLGAGAAIIACFVTTHVVSTLALGLAFAVPIWVVFATSLLHNAAHANFKPRWLNRVIGEAFGLLQLVGFPDWVVVHIIHHAHPDDPERDPHPPRDQSFKNFLLGMRASILRVLLNEYFRLHGQSPKTKRAVIGLAVGSKIEQLAKVTFIYAVAGPQVFAFFFAPSIALKMIHYAWFNYATHLPEKSSTEIVNRSEGVYRLVNFVSFGLYFHRNHHLNAKLFNPSKLPSEAVTQHGEEAA